MTSNETKGPNPVLKAYIFSVMAFLIPSWIASAMLTEDMGPDNPTPAFIVVLILFSMMCWSPSVGLFMLKRRKYALLSGFGRFAIIASGAITDFITLSTLPEGGHAYLTFLAIMLAFVWGFIDFVLIYFAGKKIRKKAN